MSGFLFVLTRGAPALKCWEPNVPNRSIVAQQQWLSYTLPPHPRLRLNDTQLDQLNRTIQSDATAKAYFDGLHDAGSAMLSEPVVVCSGDLLGAARTVLGREYTLGLLWRLTGDNRFAERAVAEMLHVTTNCSTWDPFGLVLAEMVSNHRVVQCYC